MLKLTIITVTLNNLQALKKTVESVLNQSFKEFEFIIVDGNSNDGSKEYIIEKSKHLTHWISENDTGIYNAMNKGISISKGDYLLFLNSGDVLYNETTLENIQHHLYGGKDIYYGDVIFEENNLLRKWVLPDELTFLFFLNHSLSHQATFIHHSLFDNIFKYNETYKIASDWEFFICAICKQNVSYKHLPLVVTIYDTTGISSNIANHPLMHQERQQTLNKYFPAFIEEYNNLNSLGTKRANQLYLIRKHNTAWKLIKCCLSILIFFLPKPKSISKH